MVPAEWGNFSGDASRFLLYSRYSFPTDPTLTNVAFPWHARQRVGGPTVTFEEILDQAMAMLHRRGRVTYRALKRQFQLDDDYLEDLKAELIEAQQVAIDEGGTVLVWTGGSAIEAMPTAEQARAPLSYPPRHLAEKILTSRSALEGERKQVTVLFADLKGSMELLADRDPEEARQLLDPVLEHMIAAVHQYEGTVNQVMGDGIMALFGAPIAHEDHAVRACYAALRMQETVRRYDGEVQRTHGMPVHIRVGLNSGDVVVRRIDSSLHMDYTAVGQSTHLAARMEQMAAPGSIRLTAKTLELVVGMVQVTPLGSVPVKGLPDPVEVFELIGAGPARTRLQALAARGLTPFVGRRTERRALRDTLARAGTGRGQLMAVVGEPGVGKSRLLAEFLASPLTQGWLILETHAVSYGQATPYRPIRDLLQAYFRIDDRDDERTIREKVDKVLTLDAAVQPPRVAVLALLDVSVDDPEWQALDPAQRRLRIIDGVRRLLLRQSQVQPLLVSIENLHWIDAGTQAVLDSLVESLPTATLCLLVNYRPEYQHGWGGKTYYTQLRLDPLPLESADRLLQALLGEDSSLVPLKHLLIERTEGNPFFLEESVRTLVEAQVLVGEPGAYRLVQSLRSIQVPATVQAVLAARIDRLPPEEKALLQTAAVIGTDVPFPLLQALAEPSEEALRHGLMHLQAAEFLYETKLFPTLEYTFKHALTHEVAYGGLLQERRRALHARIVEALERLYPERLAEHVDRLAHHALRGEVWDKAIRHCRQAGTKASARSAYQEAVVYIEQALVALSHLPESRGKLEQAIDLRLELRNAFLPLGEHGRIFDSLREAENLAHMLDDRQRLGQVCVYMTEYFRMMNDLDQAIQSGQRALALATALGDVGLQVMANYYMGSVYYDLGDYRRAMDVLGWNVSSLAGDLIRERFGMTGLPSVLSRVFLSWSLAELGAFAEGVPRGEEGVRIAEATDHPFSRIWAYVGIGHLYFRKGDFHRSVSMLERGFGLCQAWHIATLFPTVASNLGVAYALSGRVSEALPLLEQAASRGRRGHYFARLSEAYLLAGRTEDALERAQRALDASREFHQRGYQAYALRLLGDVVARREPPDYERAEVYYQEALALADELGMRPLQAHCHHGLGTLYATIGRPEPARTELSAAIALYRAMEMTFWLPQAEAALAQVEGR
jgi:class 3 adenylate cyclase/tetratricopeptide (TPR) repeat protein